MATFTAKDVQALRQSTGAGMLDAKKALEESDGDMDAAAQYLRVNGLAGAAKREEREASQGAVTAVRSGNAAYLRGRVGREPTAGELYIAHFLGPQGSARMIETVRTAPNTPAASLFPDAAAANLPIFYRGGRAVTVAEVYANLTHLQTGGAPPAPSGPEPAPDPSFVQYASARQTERQSEEQAVVAMILRGPASADDVGLSVQTTNSLFSTEMLRALSEAETSRRG